MKKTASQRGKCWRCKKDLPQPYRRHDGYCSAKCAKKDYYESERHTHRPCDPDHGWF